MTPERFDELDDAAHKHKKVDADMLSEALAEVRRLLVVLETVETELADAKAEVKRLQRPLDSVPLPQPFMPG